MDILLLSLGIFLTLLGLIGCIMPGLPGPPLNFVGILLIHFTRFAEFTQNQLIIYGVIAIGVYLIDNIVPIWGTKKMGGSKRGVWGSIIGLLIGMFVFPPIGIIVGPFVGAVIGELSGGKDNATAIKAGFGSLLGFLFGTVLKLVTSAWLTYVFIQGWVH